MPTRRDRPSARPDLGAPPEYTLAHPRGRELREILSRIYFNQRGIVELLEHAEVSPAHYNLEGSAHLVWGELLQKATNRMEIEQVLDTVEDDREAKRWRERLRELRRPSPLVEAEPDVDMEPSDPEEEERLLGRRSTLLDVAFLERGARMATGVVRLSVQWGRDSACGTGFLIAERRILTNHHVLFRNRGQLADRAQAWFGHELDAEAVPVKPDSYDCDVVTVLGDRTHDWAVINLCRQPDKKYFAAPFSPPSVPIELGHRVYIIQHPLGGYKQIGMHNNVTTRVTDDHIQYMTDTEAGSSGSPVFNERWELVALHHCSKAIDRTTEGARFHPNDLGPDGGTYLDAYDYRNQGVRIERVIDGLKRLEMESRDP